MNLKWKWRCRFLESTLNTHWHQQTRKFYIVTLWIIKLKCFFFLFFVFSSAFSYSLFFFEKRDALSYISHESGNAVYITIHTYIYFIWTIPMYSAFRPKDPYIMCFSFCYVYTGHLESKRIRREMWWRRSKKQKKNLTHIESTRENSLSVALLLLLVSPFSPCMFYAWSDEIELPKER